ncbi:hypothetical protein [Streptomyces sp. NBC_00140]|uniref:hypothetical protein n=1 Tax=Streptomyces sp. NBC_00140 TaxID=2975664 RepID=UPI00224F17BE|nr:hypothetical protein [Streptomyces sp. NBC_00140]MCX5328098.1 hypothetical protein [Streptomyces sp. NBC_00140]
MTNPFSLEGIRQRLSAEQISPAQADRLAEAIAGTLQRTCKEWFPGTDYDDWQQMLPELLLDVVIQLLTWGEDGQIVADHMSTAAAACIFLDLQNSAIPVG